MYKVVFLRHGESEWNRENRFTGWADPPLSPRGVEESWDAAEKLQKDNYKFDIVYTNVLKRCIKTTWIVLEKLDLMWIPIIKDWHLNERFYGDLTGLNKSETAIKHGEDQVKIWRRSYDISPPELTTENDFYPGKDPKYAHIPQPELPLSECLKDVVERMVPYWQNHIVPEIKAGKKVLVSASGNSLRAILKHLDNIPDAEILELNVPTGIPLVYELDPNLKPIKHYYLASPEELEQAINTVKKQGKKQ
jgi:2,3-bisphosphoglycerate-dependent phosphoglycerate mutase